MGTEIFGIFYILCCIIVDSFMNTEKVSMKMKSELSFGAYITIYIACIIFSPVFLAILVGRCLGDSINN